MYVRNCLIAGDHLTVIPVGLPLVLQYNSNGILERAFKGFDALVENEVTEKVVRTIRNYQTCPISVPIKTGTSTIHGVLYTSDIYKVEGELPGCIEEALLADFDKNPEKFRFYATDVSSTATLFHGIAPTRNWLSMSRFNLLPSWVIPVKFGKEEFIKMIDTDRYTFNFPMITHYLIHRKDKVLVQPTKLKQYFVKYASIYTDENGYIKSKIAFNGTDEVIYIDYSDMVSYNIHPGTMLVLDMYNTIINAYNTDADMRNPYPQKLTCRVCGNSFVVPRVGDVTCPDPHCMSKMYPALNHFLQTLKLPPIAFTAYQEYIGTGKFRKVSDVFDMDEYKDTQVDATLFQIVSALVPVSVVANTSVIQSLTNQCNNNKSTLLYYIRHADRIAQDIQLPDVFGQRLKQWLMDPYNASELESVLSSEHINVIETDKKFEGAPIFRGKTIFITGNFVHGSTADIVAILKSYSAQVSNNVADCQCVITGDSMEDLDGRSIRYAKQNNIPVFTESQFFAKYEIDEDLSLNL